jgi:hypothetical protein
VTGLRILAVAVLLGTLARPHGNHSSLTTIDYVSKTQEVQATVVLVTQDLEDFLRFQTKRPLELDRTEGVDKLVFDAVRRWLVVRDKQSRTLPWKWVGMEVKAMYVAIYLETKAPTLAGATIRNRALLDWLPSQVNQVTIRVDGTGKTSDHQFSKGADGWSAVRF